MLEDNFYTQTTCDRCGGSLKAGRIMSMYNEECLCMKCKEEERNKPDYREAQAKDIEEYIKRNGLYFSGPCVKGQ